MKKPSDINYHIWREEENMENFFLWISAMQKEIRRGNEEKAFYWAWHLVENGCFGHVRNRLRVIAHEDIGTGDLTVLPFVSQCLEDMDAWYQTKKENGCWL